MSLLFIGEAPSPSTDGRPGAEPLVGETGRRLALWAGLSLGEFRQRVRCTNLFERLPERWVNRDATVWAQRIWQELTREGGTYASVTDAVLLGHRVARAFGFTHLDPFTWYTTAGPRLALMPHPSGMNRFWNDAANVERAERFLQALLGTSVETPRQASLLGEASV